MPDSVRNTFDGFKSRCTAVQRGERTQDVQRHRDRLVHVERPVLETMRERLALEQFHDDVDVVGGFADIVNLADARWLTLAAARASRQRRARPRRPPSAVSSPRRRGRVWGHVHDTPRPSHPSR